MAVYQSQWNCKKRGKFFFEILYGFIYCFINEFKQLCRKMVTSDCNLATNFGHLAPNWSISTSNRLANPPLVKVVSLWRQGQMCRTDSITRLLKSLPFHDVFYGWLKEYGGGVGCSITEGINQQQNPLF